MVNVVPPAKGLISAIGAARGAYEIDSRAPLNLIYTLIQFGASFSREDLLVQNHSLLE